MLQRQFSIKSSTDQPTNLPGMHKAVQARHCRNSQCIVKSQCELRMQRNRNSRQHSLRRLHKRLPSLGGHGEIHCQERGTLCQTLPAPHEKMCSTAQGRCLSLLTSQTSYCSICTGSSSTSQHFSNVIQTPVHVFCGVLKIKNFLSTSPSGRAPDADQSQEANLFVEKLLVR